MKYHCNVRQMNMKFNILALVSCLCLISGCGHKIHTVEFDGTKEVSGKKFALADINPDLPENWDGYNFVIMEYRINTAQRFQVGFTTENGYNELRIMSYVPNAWNRLVIPVSYFTNLPSSAVELSATYNHPRSTGWINLGGNRGPMHKVDSIGFRMRRAIGDARLDLKNITLSVEDPGDAYLCDKPAVDKFGQSNLVDYPEKVRSMGELEAAWRAEEAEQIIPDAYNYSKFGGYRQKQVEGTGFFRVEKIYGKWWFVDPEGYLFLSVGVDCVDISPGGIIWNYEKMPELYAEIPPDDLPEKMGIQGNALPSFGMWNLYRRYGDDYRDKALDMVIRRMSKWGVNTAANWSGDAVKSSGRVAFLHQLSNLGLAWDLMGLCDIYTPDFRRNLENSISTQTAYYKDNPWLIGYFIGNEPAWLNQEERLCGMILDGKDRPIKTELQKHIRKYGDTPAARKSFIHKTFENYLTEVVRVMKKYDPNHLSLGIRFGDTSSLPEAVLQACKVFDVFSFNCYDLYPRKEMMDRVMKSIDRPMIIGEYHFGTVDRGYAQALWQVESQEQRGVAYRYYTEHAYSHPSLIGTGYFQWTDEDIAGRFDGENYNCGLVDVTDRPYKEQVEAMMKTAKVLYDIHNGTVKPFDEAPRNSRGHGPVPDLWNE